MRKLLLTALALLVGALATTGVALANMAPPWKPGDVVGEPRGAVRSVAIEREDLEIDLRPLATDDPARVTATYQVRNDGPARSLSLLFVATGLTNEGQGTPPSVWLDGAPVASQQTRVEVLPERWEPPRTTPRLAGGEGLSYQTTSMDDRAFGFSLALPPGRHEIRVTYSAAATAYSGESPVRYWQLGYVLAPARDWASFGGLGVRVEVPAGWSAASEPTLVRQDDTLAGSFDTLPADTLALTVQAPVPMVIDTLTPAWIAGLALSLLVGVVVGRWLGRARRSSLWALIPALGVGIAWAVLVLGVATAPFLGDIPASQEAWVYGYGDRMLALLTSPIAFVCGVVVTQLAAVVAKRSVRLLSPAPAGL